MTLPPGTSSQARNRVQLRSVYTMYNQPKIGPVSRQDPTLGRPTWPLPDGSRTSYCNGDIAEPMSDLAHLAVDSGESADCRETEISGRWAILTIVG